LVDAAYNLIDVRRFAMREWGWKAIRENNVDTWNLTSDDLKKISSGLNDAYSYEIEQYDNEKLDAYGNKGPYFNIEVYSRGDYYNNVPLDLIEQDISKILPYRTIVRGSRITERRRLIDKMDLNMPNLTEDLDAQIQRDLDNLSRKYQFVLDSAARVYKDYIDLEDLLAYKDTPVGTGTAYMKELCDIADKNNKLIVLHVAKRGYGGGNNLKKTTSAARLKTFYSRFGFVDNKSKYNYRPDLIGDMHRIPKKL
jgi:hypothetical protein